MNLNSTWQLRLRKLAVTGVAGGVAVLLAGSAVNGYQQIHTMLYPPPPVWDVARTAAWDVAGAHDDVAAFAENCVEAILMATAATAKTLGDCAPRDRGYTFGTDTPRTTTTVASSAKAVRAIRRGPFYAVKVAVQVRSYPTASAVTEYYSLPIAVTAGTSPQVIGKIARLPDLPPGPAAGLRYGISVKPDSELHAVLAGFITALLTGGDLGRYVAVGSNIRAIGGYGHVQMLLAMLDGEPAQPPTDGDMLAAYAEITADRSDATHTEQLAYPLSLRCDGGKWYVTSIDAMPIAGLKEEGNR